MKISKLFHWLYALVMLLPIFAIGTTCLISTFNMSSKEETEIHYRYETNEVNSANDLIVGNIYHFSAQDVYFQFDNDESFEGNILRFSYFNFSQDSLSSSIDEFAPSPLLLTSNFSFYLVGTLDNIDFYFYNPSIESFVATLLTFDTNYQDYFFDFDFVLTNKDNITYLLPYLSASSYNEIESVETHNVNPQNVFYNAVDKVTESPLFSWAYDSFLVAPFSYIVALFGMPTNHVVVELLSYWLAISIIWLVFDLIMYVPLLVHRWLDKGVLE